MLSNPAANLLEFSEDSAIQIELGLDEDYILSFEDGSTTSYETLEKLYEGLTRLDLRGMLIPSSAFHDIEVLMQRENRAGRTEKYFTGYDFEKADKNDIEVNEADVQAMLNTKGDNA